jgi:hypothetical protein
MLSKRKTAGTLSDLAGSDGITHCVFMCCDLPYQYIGEYFQKLGAEEFPPIRNEVSFSRPRTRRRFHPKIPHIIVDPHSF